MSVVGAAIQEGPARKIGSHPVIRFLKRLPISSRIGGLLILLYIALAAGASIVAPYPPDEIFVGAPFEPISAQFWLGTDNLGRDVLTRVLYGGRTVLLTGALAAAISASVGGLIGMFLGYRGGLVDEVAMRALEVILSIPSIVFALLILGTLGASAPLVTLTVGLLSVPNVSRVVRAATQAVAAEDFVAAARARGESSLSIVLREILPNVSGTLIVEFSIRTGYAILFIGSLGFLGFGAQPPMADWGLMVNEGRGAIDASIWPVVAPALGMALLVTAVNLFTDGIIQSLGPAEQGGAA